MKRNLWKLISLILTICFLLSSNAQAATKAEIDNAIGKGLAWLVQQQQPGGYWQPWEVATTGLVLLKLVDRAKELKKDPFDNDPSSSTYYQYANNVIAGFDYLFSNASSDVSGVNFSGIVYYTGISMMAVASTNAPTRVINTGVLNGLTYQQALQRMMNWMVAAQNDYDDCGMGGWGYGSDSPGWADNSNSGYASIGIGMSAIKPPEGFGILVPAAVITDLDTFITNVQVPSGQYAGGSVYDPCWGNSSGWVNILKTGNLLYEMAIVGKEETDAPVKSAISFIETYWNNGAGVYDGGGWQGDYQAMFTMMKGLESFGISKLTVGGSEIDWFDQVSTYIVNNQNPNSSWIGTAGETATSTIDTAWALLTLEKVVKKVEFSIPDQCVPSGDFFTCFDADNYVIIGTPPYTWTWKGNINLSVTKDINNVFCITYPANWTGTETITFTVTDAHGVTKDDTATFTVDPVPIIAPIPNQTAPFTPFDLDNYVSGVDPSAVCWSYSGNSCLQVSIGNHNVVTVTNPGACTRPETITFTATAKACEEEVSRSVKVTFTPNRPPDCTKAIADPGCLWPPNHQWVPVSILGVTDPDGDPVTITITKITSDEPTASDKGSGGATHAPDASGVGTSSTAMIRSERSGNGDGRVYVITFTANDGKGGTCEGSVMVNVPHDQSSKVCPAIDSGQKYDATKIN